MLLRPSCEVFHVVVSTEAHYRDPNFLHKYFFDLFFLFVAFSPFFAAFAHKTVLFCMLKDLHKANNAPKVISKSFIVEVSMSDVLRPYRDLFPQIGQRVMIDDSSVVIGDVRLADDVGI